VVHYFGAPSLIPEVKFQSTLVNVSVDIHANEWQNCAHASKKGRACGYFLSKILDFQGIFQKLA